MPQRMANSCDVGAIPGCFPRTTILLSMVVGKSGDCSPRSLSPPDLYLVLFLSPATLSLPLPLSSPLLLSPLSSLLLFSTLDCQHGNGGSGEKKRIPTSWLSLSSPSSRHRIYAGLDPARRSHLSASTVRHEGVGEREKRIG